MNSESVFGPNTRQSPGRGMNVAIIDEVSGQVLVVRHFNTAQNSVANGRFQRILRGVRNGKILVIAVRDDGASMLNDASRAVLRELGSTMINALARRDSWCFITRVGHPTVHVNEALTKRRNGVAKAVSFIPVGVPATAPFINVFARSEGRDDGNGAEIMVNSVSVFGSNAGAPFAASRGMNAAVIDEVTGTILSIQIFDTSASPAADLAFQNFLQNVPRDRILAIAIMGDGSLELSNESKPVLESFSSTQIENLNRRESWCFVTRVGRGSAFLAEMKTRRDRGGAQVFFQVLPLST